MRLGLNSPRGPIEFADHVGTERLLSLLQNMQRISGDDRYRPSLWLRRRALLGLSAAVAI
jgi:3-hydroxybutyryl-CoA dehydrogenase